MDIHNALDNDPQIKELRKLLTQFPSQHYDKERVEIVKAIKSRRLKLFCSAVSKDKHLVNQIRNIGQRRS